MVEQDGSDATSGEVRVHAELLHIGGTVDQIDHHEGDRVARRVSARTAARLTSPGNGRDGGQIRCRGGSHPDTAGMPVRGEGGQGQRWHVGNLRHPDLAERFPRVHLDPLKRNKFPTVAARTRTGSMPDTPPSGHPGNNRLCPARGRGARSPRLTGGAGAPVTR
ncbi:hypothetical protein [Micromonospora rubida]|uniref:hypothetical protein n=1 Tax=Micromonospora rubida TaxID=2697657 RepID=UPI00191BDA35|nr:hypothetical protein [Micromonospora rubida]